MADIGDQFITTEEFDALLREEAQRLSNFVPTLNGAQLQPMIVALLNRKETNSKREAVLIAVPSMPEGDEKRQMLFALGAKVAGEKLQVVGAFLATEAWMKVMTQAEGWRTKKHGVPQPSKCADRQETIILWGRTIDGRLKWGLAPLNHQSKKVSLGVWKFSNPADGIEDNLLSYFFAGYLLGSKAGGSGK